MDCLRHPSLDKWKEVAYFAYFRREGLYFGSAKATGRAVRTSSSAVICIDWCFSAVCLVQRSV